MQGLKRTFKKVFFPSSWGRRRGSNRIEEDVLPAQRFAVQALVSGKLLQSFNTLKNINKTRIRTLFDFWAGPGSRKNLSPAAQDAVWSLINIRSAADFKMHVYRAITWLRRKVGNRPYAVLVEVDGFGPYKLKSSLWLAAPLIRSFKRPPAMVIPVMYGGLDAGLVRQAMALDIADFVHIDDTVYSGQQKGGLVKNFRAIIPQRSPVRLYIAAAYTSRAGEDFVRARIGTSRSVEYFASHVLTRREIQDPSIIGELRAKRVNLYKAPLSTIMPHKIPNGLSFAPANFGAVLDMSMPSPPYKAYRNTTTTAAGLRRKMPKKKPIY